MSGHPVRCSTIPRAAQERRTQQDLRWGGEFWGPGSLCCRRGTIVSRQFITFPVRTPHSMGGSSQNRTLKCVRLKHRCKGSSSSCPGLRTVQLPHEGGSKVNLYDRHTGASKVKTEQLVKNMDCGESTPERRLIYHPSFSISLKCGVGGGRGVQITTLTVSFPKWC